jgi:glycerol uptake facilitator-like aquaporin
VGGGVARTRSVLAWSHRVDDAVQGARAPRPNMPNRTTDPRVAARGQPASSGGLARAHPRMPPLGQLLRNSGYEAVLTAVLLFGVASVVRWIIGASPISRTFPDIHLELLLVGIVVGLLLAGLILSPLGKASGGHLNPAISLAMWRFGVFPGWSVLPYAAAQLMGSVLGVLLARAVWGPSLAEPSVGYAALKPAPGWSNGMVFLVEGTSMAVIIVLVGVFLSVPRLAPRVPWLVGCLIGAAIAGLGTITGGCVNPARQFGPAVFARQFGFLPAYLLAPLAGAIVAPWLVSRFQHRKVLTHRLCGDPGLDAAHDDSR